MALATSTWVAIGVAAAGAAASNNQSRKSQAHQDNAEEAKVAAQQSADAEMRRQRYREERVKRAQIIQFAQGSGVSQSSGVEGATSSLATQVGSSVAFQTGQQEASKIIGSEMKQASDYNTRANTYGQVSNLATSYVTQTQDFKSLFKE